MARGLLHVKNFRFGGFILTYGLLVLLLAGCSEQSTDDAAAPAKTAAPVKTAAPKAVVVNNDPKLKIAQELFDAATLKTVEWPGHPDWPRVGVSADGTGLGMSAYVPDQPPTTVQVPVPPGQYGLTASVSLRDVAESPAVLTIDWVGPDGKATRVSSLTVNAGQTVPLDAHFTVADAGSSLKLVLAVAPDAKGYFGEQMQLSDLKLRLE